MTKCLSKYTYQITLFLLCAIIALQYGQSPLYNYYFGDTSVYQYIGKLMLEGKFPYRDVFDHKGPLVYPWHMLGYAIHPMNGQYYLETIWLFFASLTAFNITQKFLSPLKAFIITALTFLAIPYFDTIGNTESLALFPLMLILQIFVKYYQNNEISIKDSILFGGLTSVLLLIKPLYLPIPGIFGLAIVISDIMQKDSRQLKIFLIAAGSAFVIPVLLTIIWIHANDALPAFWQDYILFNLIYTNTDLGFYVRNKTFWYFFQMPVIFTAFVLSVFLILKRNAFSTTQKKLMAVVLTTFYISFFILILPAKPFSHYILVLFPLILLIFAFSLQIIKSKPLIISLLEAALIISLLALYDKFSLMKGYKGNIYLIKAAEFIRTNSRPEETFASLACFTHGAIYLYANRNSATRYPYACIMEEIAPDKLLTELNAKKPKWIVIAKQQITDNAPHHPVYENRRYIIYTFPEVKKYLEYILSPQNATKK